ncbi:hypothetical protein CC2G_013677 [Coprinopsis cinerea AmutBmut pab1-1]|nr:hypothetical protein CC2G_013677 [Coprinopsis cinerea AmutBmut pab1-1]
MIHGRRAPSRTSSGDAANASHRSRGPSRKPSQTFFRSKSRNAHSRVSAKQSFSAQDVALDFEHVLEEALFSTPDVSDTATRGQWKTGDPYHHPIPSQGDAWEESFRVVQRFDDEMCRGWREEIDTLLVFAGLFSATVTAFTVESYRQLHPDSVSDDLSVQLLARISDQLLAAAPNANLPPNPVTLNTVVEEFTPTPSSVRVNVFWFTSLTIALTTVLVGILCKQWLREYQRYEGLSPKEAFPVRQMRYEGLLRWHVPTMLSCLPLFLQASLILFFAGLLDLLWSIHNVVATVVSLLVGITMLFIITTTILPFSQYLFHFSRLNPTVDPQSQCAFKSPQSRAFHLLGTSILNLARQCKDLVYGYGVARDYLRISIWNSDVHWVNYDLEWTRGGRYMQRAVSWFERTFSRNIVNAFHVFHCLQDLNVDVAAGCITEIIHSTWSPFTPFAGLLLPRLREVDALTQTDEEDVLVSQDLVMMGYLITHHRNAPCFLERCLELCTRLINSPIDGTDAVPLALEVLAVITPDKNLSETLLSQLVDSLSSIFRSDKLNLATSDVQTFWKTFDLLQHHQTSLSPSPSRLKPSSSLSTSMTALPSPPSDIPRRPAYAILREMQSWLRRIMDDPDTPAVEKEYLINECCLGILRVYSSLRARHPDVMAVDSKFRMSADFQILVDFVKSVDEFIVQYEGLTDLLVVWEMVRVEVLGSVEEVTDEEEVLMGKVEGKDADVKTDIVVVEG